MLLNTGHSGEDDDDDDDDDDKDSNAFDPGQLHPAVCALPHNFGLVIILIISIIIMMMVMMMIILMTITILHFTFMKIMIAIYDDNR